MSGWVHAQSDGNPVVDAPAADDYRNQPRSARSFDDSQWKSLHESLDYTEQAAAPRQVEERSYEPKPPQAANPLGKIALLLVVAALLAFFLWRILMSNPLKRNKAISNQPELPEDADGLEANLLDSDPAAHIAQAEAEAKWHLAVRLHYLALLKSLHLAGHIGWQKNKTNRDYLLETASWDKTRDFRHLTKAYEQVWYGLHYPSESDYRELAADFITLRQAANQPVSA